MLARLTTAMVLAVGCAAHQRQAPAPEVLHVYLARHGQTDWNAEHRIQGWADRHLNANGRAQAAALGTRLQGIHLDAVYSSALARSRETAEIVHGAVPIESLAGLDERNVGSFEGTLLGERGDPAVAAEFDRRAGDPRDDLGGGETTEAFFQRVRETVSSIRQHHPSGAILIVGHGGTNAMILRALGLPEREAADLHQANDDLYLVDVGPEGGRRLWKLLQRFVQPVK
jgi:broad specificity phosphatase PhoE